MNKKMNNKGFSLVELIIVIAIMAVLVGVLAPQFLKYVERSRKSTDVQAVAEIISAVNVYVADPSHTVPAGDYTINLSTAATTITAPTAVATTNADSLFQASLNDAGIKSIVLKSSNWSASTITLKATVNANNGVTFECAAAPGLLTGSY